MTSDRGRRCFHCEAEVQPLRTASMLAMSGFAMLIILAIAGLLLGVPWAAGLVGRLQQVDDVYRVWRVGVALAVYLLIFILVRYFIGIGRGEHSTYVAPKVGAASEQGGSGAGQ